MCTPLIAFASIAVGFTVCICSLKCSRTSYEDYDRGRRGNEEVSQPTITLAPARSTPATVTTPLLPSTSVSSSV